MYFLWIHTTFGNGFLQFLWQKNTPFARGRSSFSRVSCFIVNMLLWLLQVCFPFTHLCFRYTVSLAHLGHRTRGRAGSATFTRFITRPNYKFLCFVSFQRETVSCWTEIHFKGYLGAVIVRSVFFFKIDRKKVFLIFFFIFGTIGLKSRISKSLKCNRTPVPARGENELKCFCPNRAQTHHETM